VNDNKAFDSENETDRPLGVLECVAHGFDITAQRPYLLLPMLLLDMFLWLGPRLSLERLIADFVALWPTPTPEVMPIYQILHSWQATLAHEFNLFTLLSLAPTLGVPSLMREQMTLTHPWGERGVLLVASGWGLLGWVVLLGAIGLWLNALYLVPLGRAIIEDTASPLPGPPQVSVLWRQLAQFTLYIIGMLLMVCGPGLLLINILANFNATLGLFTLLSGFTLAMYILLQLLFTVPGLLQLRRKVLPAVQESILLVRVDFGGVVGLVSIALLLLWGFNIIWELVDPTSWFTLFSILGHAIIATALTAALLIFYQTRLAYLQSLQASYATRAAQASATDV